jgi:translocation and assembly module TamB
VGAFLLAALLMLLAATTMVWWTLRTEAGTAWLIERLPGIEVHAGRGTLWGDFSAQRLDLALPGGARLIVEDLSWHGLRLSHAPGLAYQARVSINALEARRIELQRPQRKDQPNAGRQAPHQLRVPVEIDVTRLRVAELHLDVLAGRPLRDVQARVHLGDGRGARHQVDNVALTWETVQVHGEARLAADGALPLHLSLRATHAAAAGAPAWQAQLNLDGPLAEPMLNGTVRVEPAAGHPLQSLDLRAGLRLFDPWPLGEMQARTQALDLSLFHPAAPVTSLSGSATARTSGLDQPAAVIARLTNARAGRWNEGRLPVREATLELRARPGDPRELELRALHAQLGTEQQPAGRIDGHGRWDRAQWQLEAQLDAVQPASLDSRAPEMRLHGPVTARGSGWADGTAGWRVDLQADLTGSYERRGPSTEARLRLDATASLDRIELRQAQAWAGSARASLAGTASRASPSSAWHLEGRAELADFDPNVWWPGAGDSPWRRGPHRLNALARIDVAWSQTRGSGGMADRLAAVHGQADLTVSPSVLAGVPLTGEAHWRDLDGDMTQARLAFESAGNRIEADGRFHRTGAGANDQWAIKLAAPGLERLAPLWHLLPMPAAAGALAGSIKGDATLSGRWPALATRGTLDADGLRVGQTQVSHGQARWQVDMSGARPADAPIELSATLEGLSFSQTLFKGTPPVESAGLQLHGTLAFHTAELRAHIRAMPPAWTETFQPQAANQRGAAAKRTDPLPTQSTVLITASGGAVAGPRGSTPAWTGWRGRVSQAELRSMTPGAQPWLATRDIEAEVNWAPAPLRWVVQPGHAQVLGATLRWSRIAWTAGETGLPAQLEALAELEPLSIAPLLARAQPAFGWGGDLAVSGRIEVRSAPAFSANVVLERRGGDLTVTDEAGNVQALGLTDLRLALDAHDGVWSFTQGLAGKTLGVAAGAVVARTSPQAVWPAPDTPIQGVLEVQVTHLGNWGPWVPAGWRLSGALRTSATIGGRFAAPEYTGRITGSGIGVRNFLQGVNVSDGEVDIELRGETARIERLGARAGNGTVRVEGDATFGEAPSARLRVLAEKFQVLGRVDRRLVTSGQAQMQLDRRAVALDGKFTIDEGLIDFTRSDAPRLSDDVVVVRQAGSAPAEPASPRIDTTVEREARINLDVWLGDQLRLRGRGLDTGLSGELRITSPGNKMAVNGTVSTVGGTYAAYGQKLAIERGQVTFNGPVENPRLDIEATRPHLDLRVGVLVTGTALNPRVRLFSEPEMAEVDKLSWLVLGRAGDNLGRTDTALLQRAALALWAGEGEGLSDQFTHAIGLDELSLRQTDGTDGGVRETVISLGKQISQRWYVGYERSLNATAGSWQLIYRIAQRFTVRAQTGKDNSLDVIWTWRWH